MVRATAAWVRLLLHRLFNATLAVKGTLALIEASVGAGLWLQNRVPEVRELPVEMPARWLSRHDLAIGPDDPLLTWTSGQAAGLNLPPDTLYYLYLVAHGLLKLAMVLLLARRVRWAYPAAMAVLGLFVAYQLVEFSRNGSAYLLMLCLFDGFMIFLVWREYRILPRMRAPAT